MESNNNIKANNEKLKFLIFLTLTFLGITSFIFFLFLIFAIPPSYSGIMGIGCGFFICFLIMGINGYLKEFIIKSPFFEISSKLEEKIEKVNYDINESKKDTSEKINDLKQNISLLYNSINNLVSNISNTNVNTKSISQSNNTSNIFTDQSKMVKQIRFLMMELVNSGLKNNAYNVNNPEVQKIMDELLKIQQTYGSLDSKIDFLNKGIISGIEGNYDKAIQENNKVLEKDPNNINALNNLGFSFMSLGKYDESITYLEKALELDPKFLPAIVNKGSILRLTGNYEGAIEYYDKAISIDPDFQLALINKQKLLNSLKDK
jgi:tetratricopeptide (TPR) repeat protein